MRRITVTAALAGLLALGIAAPATAAQAAGNTAAGTSCETWWTERDGYMYAWDTADCQGNPMYSAKGNSTYWGAAANDKASSVMNRGFTGGNDVVAFYEAVDHGGGHTCLTAGEKWADDLTDNRFHVGSRAVSNAITSHQWVRASACSMFLT